MKSPRSDLGEGLVRGTGGFPYLFKRIILNPTMAKDVKFETQIKYVGIFNFRDFYEFCFNWLKEEMSMTVVEKIYEEKIKGNEKELKIEWTAIAKPAEYFHFNVDVKFEIKRLADVEVTQGGKKIKTNSGEVKMKIKGTLVKDPAGQFETGGKMKVWRTMYEKFLIPSRVKQYEDVLIAKSSEFAAQIKSFLDIEGRM